MCKCGRKANKTYNNKNWCCIECPRSGLHTSWCAKKEQTEQHMQEWQNGEMTHKGEEEGQ